MANKSLFTSQRGERVPAANTTNEAGGLAYVLEPKHALAQYAATGCLNATFYASARDQLAKVLGACERVDADFIAKTAIYARQKAFMKDLPALLCAVLSVKSPRLLPPVFDRVIDSPKMLRNFVQIMRSGVVGRKSLGSLPKRLIVKWIDQRSDDRLFVASIGRDPSLADIIKMVHPKPKSRAREALFGYLIGREHNHTALPDLVRAYENFKSDPRGRAAPDIPFQFLTSLDLSRDTWQDIARRAPWQMTRMNLNAFLRHGVFENDSDLTDKIAERLRSRDEIRQARVFPYQLLVAYVSARRELPRKVRDALQDALEVALENVPAIEGKVYVFPDVSGSMHNPVTGQRHGASSAVRCVDVAALVAAAILRKNADTEVIPFESKIVDVDLNARDTVMTNAKTLAALPCGGTNCSAPLAHLNRRKARGDVVVYVSDNESWLDSPRYGWFGGGSATRTLKEWQKFKTRNPNARMVCIDLQPYAHTQAKERQDIVNVGGFSDQVFELIADVAASRHDKDHWVRLIEAVSLSEA